MSIWMSASSSPKRKLANAFASSVLPTPEGPAKMNEPPGRRGSLRPARVRRIAWLTLLMASSWPMIRLWSSSSMRRRRVVSSSVSLKTGMPVQFASTSAICSSSTSATTSMSPAFHCFSRSDFSPSSCFSLSRRDAAFSKSWASIADSFSRRMPEMRSSNSRRSGGAVIRLIRIRAPASSIRSIALSGRKRSEMYRSASVAGATRALSVMLIRWCASYRSRRPLRISIVWASVGSPTWIGWKRRSRAASFSRCLRYSSSVVAPMVCSSPRASIGLRMLAAGIAPLRGPRPDEGVDLVDEQDDVAAGADLLEDLLQPLLEVTAVTRAGDERAEVEGVELLVLERLGHLALDDRLGQPLDDGGLADARLADEDGVVLRTAGQHLHDP